MLGQLAASFQRTREGSELKFVGSNDGDPVKQQYAQAEVIGLVVAKVLPAIRAARLPVISALKAI